MINTWSPMKNEKYVFQPSVNYNIASVMHCGLKAKALRHSAFLDWKNPDEDDVFLSTQC